MRGISIEYSVFSLLILLELTRGADGDIIGTLEKKEEWLNVLLS